MLVVLEVENLEHINQSNFSRVKYKEVFSEPFWIWNKAIIAHGTAEQCVKALKEQQNEKT